MLNLGKRVTLVAFTLIGFLMLSQPSVAATTTLGTGDCAQQVDGLTGAVTQNGNYCIVAFTGPAVSSGESGTWTVPVDVTEIDLLVVGGGGGGGNFGGGGAGAMFTDSSIDVTPGTDVPVTIGTGGALSSSATAAGSNGLPSSFADVTAYGGGGGSSVAQTAGAAVYSATSPGGSGGGAVASPVSPWKTVGNDSGTSNDKQTPATTGSAAGTDGVGLRSKGGDANPIYVYFSNANYTYTGGSSGTGISITFWQGAGGGGAGASGGDIEWESNGLVGKTGDAFNTVFAPGAGGAGSAVPFLTDTDATALGVGEVSGSAVYFAGGGGGKGNFDAASTEPRAWDYLNNTFLSYALHGVGGLGGGGGIGDNRFINGAVVAAASPGFANSGGGGKAGAAGGSGVVVVRYLIPGSEPPPDDNEDDDNSDTPRHDELAATGPQRATLDLGIAGSLTLIAVGIALAGRSALRRATTPRG